MTVTLEEIVVARQVINGHVLRTPMLPAPNLSALTGAESLASASASGGSISVSNGSSDTPQTWVTVAVSEPWRTTSLDLADK